MIKCSIGICVYNEEKNIKKLLKSLFTQKLHSVVIDEVFVIASGSTDKTCDIVESFKNTHSNLRLIRQKSREGKASAVNLFIKIAKNNILVLVGGDLILSSTVIQKLVEKFVNPEIGMSGARPIPLNSINDGLIGFAGNLMWDLHHRISLKRPKMGEVIAFRRVFWRISPFVGADEANIEPLILIQGFRIHYVPEAKVYNKTPSSIKDFLIQRRRNSWLHFAVKEEQHYLVSTFDTWLIVQAISSFLKENINARYYAYTSTVILLEIISRVLGWWDYKILKKRYTIWEIIESTKELKEN